MTNKQLIGTLLLCFVASAGVSIGTYWLSRPAPAPTYQLSPVTTRTEALTCAAKGGKAATVADVDTAGNFLTDWTAACLIPVK